MATSRMPDLPDGAVISGELTVSVPEDANNVPALLISTLTVVDPWPPCCPLVAMLSVPGSIVPPSWFSMLSAPTSTLLPTVNAQSVDTTHGVLPLNCSAPTVATPSIVPPPLMNCAVSLDCGADPA